MASPYSPSDFSETMRAAERALNSLKIVRDMLGPDAADADRRVREFEAVVARIQNAQTVEELADAVWQDLVFTVGIYLALMEQDSTQPEPGVVRNSTAEIAHLTGVVLMAIPPEKATRLALPADDPRASAASVLLSGFYMLYGVNERATVTGSMIDQIMPYLIGDVPTPPA